MTTATIERQAGRATDADQFELPRWYARIASHRQALSDPHVASVQFGPVTVFRPHEGCRVTTFGSPDDPSGVVFDGYLFDRRALAAELEIDGTPSDVELAACAYQKWGSDMFDRLDGRYLIAVWDARARRAFIGHDALGRHPVFYASASDGTWFSSNVLALANNAGISKRPNRVSVALLVLTWWPEAGQTFFESIRRVRPGHFLDVSDAAGITEQKYWDTQPDDDSWLTADRVIEEFEPALKRAVQRCMDLEPQGIMLSGGVDSVTVAALAAEVWKARRIPSLVAVSGRTGHELTYEERAQTKVADILGMRHLVSTTKEWLEGRDDASASLEMTAELPTPSRIYWVGTYSRFYRRTAAQGVNVLLTGAGGDNWLGVADLYAADLMRQFRFAQLTRFMKADIATGGASLRNSARRLLWTSGLRPHVDHAWARIAPKQKRRYHLRKWSERLPSWFATDPALREELIDHLYRRRMPPFAAKGGAPRSYYRHSLRSTPNPYMHYENETTFHIERACGLRLLSPYHDRRLVSFLNRIPPEVLVHGNRYKGLLRPVVAKRLPQLGFEDQRKEYSREGQMRHFRELRDSIARIWPRTQFNAIGSLGVVDRARVEHETHEGKEIVALAQMFNLVSSELWLRAHTTLA